MLYLIKLHLNFRRLILIFPLFFLLDEQLIELLLLELRRWRDEIHAGDLGLGTILSRVEEDELPVLRPGYPITSYVAQKGYLSRLLLAESLEIDVAEITLILCRKGYPLAVGRPGEIGGSRHSPDELRLDEGLDLAAFHIQQPYLIPAVYEGDLLAVRGEFREELLPLHLGEPSFLFQGEVVEEYLVISEPVRDINDLLAVGTPTDMSLYMMRFSHPESVPALFGGDSEYLTPHHEGYLLGIG